MRAVVQRVSRAAVTVERVTVGEIGTGLAVLVGVTHGDTESDSVALADKLKGLRIFPDSEGRMNRSVEDVGGAILVVSQFTLFGDARKGRRPSFVDAADPEVAEPLITTVVDRISDSGIPTATGRFGARMEVTIVNDGPVTMVLEVVDGRLV